jgi:hypothetical protein
MLDTHIDLATVPVQAHQEQVRDAARSARQGSGSLRLALGHGLVRLGELIGGVPADRVGTTLPTPVTAS